METVSKAHFVAVVSEVKTRPRAPSVRWSVTVPISPPCLCQAYGVPSLRSSNPPLINCGNESGSVLPMAGVVAFGVEPGRGVRVVVGSGPGVLPGGWGVAVGLTCGGGVGWGGGVEGGGGTYEGPENAKSSRWMVKGDSACIRRLARACWAAAGETIAPVASGWKAPSGCASQGESALKTREPLESNHDTRRNTRLTPDAGAATQPLNS